MKQLLKGIIIACRNPISKGGCCIVKGDYDKHINNAITYQTQP